MKVFFRSVVALAALCIVGFTLFVMSSTDVQSQISHMRSRLIFNIVGAGSAKPEITGTNGATLYNDSGTDWNINGRLTQSAFAGTDSLNANHSTAIFDTLVISGLEATDILNIVVRDSSRTNGTRNPIVAPRLYEITTIRSGDTAFIGVDTAGIGVLNGHKQWTLGNLVKYDWFVIGR